MEIFNKITQAFKNSDIVPQIVKDNLPEQLAQSSQYNQSQPQPQSQPQSQPQPQNRLQSQENQESQIKRQKAEEILANPKYTYLNKKLEEIKNEREFIKSDLLTMEKNRESKYRELYQAMYHVNMNIENIHDTVELNQEIKRQNNLFQNYARLGDYYWQVLKHPIFNVLFKVPNVSSNYYYSVNGILYYDDMNKEGKLVDPLVMYFMKFKQEKNQNEIQLGVEKDKINVEKEQIQMQKDQLEKEKLEKAQEEEQERLQNQEIIEKLDKKKKELEEKFLSETKANEMLDNMDKQLENMKEPIPAGTETDTDTDDMSNTDTDTDDMSNTDTDTDTDDMSNTDTDEFNN